MFAFARATAADETADEDQRLRAIRLLGWSEASQADDIASLVALLVPQASGAIAGRRRRVAGPARLATTVPPALLGRLERPRPRTALASARRAAEPAQRSQGAAGGDRRRRTFRPPISTPRAASGCNNRTTKQIRAARRQAAGRSHRNQPGPSGRAASGRARHCPATSRPAPPCSPNAVPFATGCAAWAWRSGPTWPRSPTTRRTALLTAILDPNKAVEAKFLDYLAITTSGLSHTGLLANETGNSVTLMGQEGKQQTILRSELEALQATGKSLMPEGMEKDLSQQDLANVIAYLRGSGALRKVFEANHPRLVTPTTDGTLQLYPTNCEIYGPTIVMEQLYKNLGKWQSENDKAVWNVELPKAGRYQMLLNYACLDEDAGNTWLLEVTVSSAADAVAAAPAAAGTDTAATDAAPDRPSGAKLTGKVPRPAASIAISKSPAAKSICPPARSKSPSAPPAPSKASSCNSAACCSSR